MRKEDEEFHFELEVPIANTQPEDVGLRLEKECRFGVRELRLGRFIPTLSHPKDCRQMFRPSHSTPTSLFSP